jgi:hypothetical protein
MLPMKRHRMTRRFPLLLLPLLLVLVGAVLCLRFREKDDGLAHQAAELESAQSVGGPSGLVGGVAPNRAPRLASPLLEASLKAEAAAVDDEKQATTNRSDRDRFFAEERRVMAKTWGLTLEQAAEFEIAVNEGNQERQGVFDRLTRDNLTPMEVAGQLRAADEHFRQRLLEMLGPDHLLEYQITSGHFVEAGLDHKPFVPPTFIPSPKTADQPAGVGSESQPAPPASL